MIKIWEPRYRDHSVLVARYKIPAGQDIDINIQRGAYKGQYHISSEVICSSPIEQIISRNGNKVSMRAIPLNRIERKEDE